MIAVAAWIAKQERLRISERVKAALKLVKEKGTRSGRPVGRRKAVFRRDHYRTEIADLKAEVQELEEENEELQEQLDQISDIVAPEEEEEGDEEGDIADDGDVDDAQD